MLTQTHAPEESVNHNAREDERYAMELEKRRHMLLEEIAGLRARLEILDRMVKAMDADSTR